MSPDRKPIYVYSCSKSGRMQVYEYVVAYWWRWMTAPRIVQISKALGMGKSTVQHHLSSLVDDLGVLDHVPTDNPNAYVPKLNGTFYVGDR